MAGGEWPATKGRRSMPANVYARRLVFHVTLVLLLAATASAADLQVTLHPDAYEIGQDLVLEFQLPGGADVAPAQLTVTATGSFLAPPYPVKALGGGRYEFAAPVKLDAEPGTFPLKLSVTYPSDAGAAEAGWTGDVKLDFGGKWSSARITWFIANKGLPLFLLVVFGFGILMSFTPCIYPMIPITLAVIGAQSTDKGVVKGFLLALTYGLGLALVYAVIGAVSATIFSGVTAFLQSPAVLVPIALLMFTLSFAMFGAYELQAPAFLRNRLQGPGGNRAGLFGALVMGMIAGLVASPCVGPFLGALLLWVGTTGSIGLGFWTLFVFGLGLSILLVVVGTFPAAMGSLPQSGGWMDTVKKAMGLLLVFMAFFFLRPGLVLPAKIFYPLLGAVTVAVATFMGAFDRLGETSSWWDRTRKALGVLCLVAGLWLLVGSWIHYGWLLPPLKNDRVMMTAAPAHPAAAPSSPNETTSSAALPAKVPFEVVHTGENVRAFLDARIATAKETGRPVVIDFWATWCKVCQVLDKKVWVDPAVIAESQRFQSVKIDCTDMDAEMEAIWAEFQVGGLPTIAFIDSRGEILHGKTVTGFKEASEMAALMSSVR
jgi:thiol:disulfide interchange protein DsbD